MSRLAFLTFYYLWVWVRLLSLLLLLLLFSACFFSVFLTHSRLLFVVYIEQHIPCELVHIVTEIPFSICLGSWKKRKNDCEWTSERVKVTSQRELNSCKGFSSCVVRLFARMCVCFRQINGSSHAWYPSYVYVRMLQNDRRKIVRHFHNINEWLELSRLKCYAVCHHQWWQSNETVLAYLIHGIR